LTRIPPVDKNKLKPPVAAMAALNPVAAVTQVVFCCPQTQNPLGTSELTNAKTEMRAIASESLWHA
jgi:hypothetical protein